MRHIYFFTTLCNCIVSLVNISVQNVWSSSIWGDFIQLYVFSLDGVCFQVLLAAAGLQTTPWLSELKQKSGILTLVSVGWLGLSLRLGCAKFIVTNCLSGSNSNGRQRSRVLLQFCLVLDEVLLIQWPWAMPPK